MKQLLPVEIAGNHHCRKAELNTIRQMSGAVLLEISRSTAFQKRTARSLLSAHAWRLPSAEAKERWAAE
ncbi:hypothetical protein [Bosea sp. PAMC 26642]|uniref:hypothetical protein n=1 Tax=Bosea sp. (strain PAMC 26642) TaxID=1792307 RepID=UPI0007703CC6|nr:hypothetical protein [Bosea sp. PAMC 26642]AMJ61053.1 hypothetical protein AXW83_12815 [Bosea sp. PAMC 26642]